MRGLFSSAVVAASVAFALAAAAPAAAATHFQGDYNITTNTNDATGLVVGANKVANLDFTLNQGDSTGFFTLFQIYTPEKSVNTDDLNAKPIKVSFAFTLPTFVGDATGTTVGEGIPTIFGYVGDNGVLTWDNGGVFDFAYGNGGLLQLTLKDADFGGGLLDLHPYKTADVKAKFKLISEAAVGSPNTGAVPEPATWAMMITGFGLAGATLRRRRLVAVA